MNKQSILCMLSFFIAFPFPVKSNWDYITEQYKVPAAVAVGLTAAVGTTAWYIKKQYAQKKPLETRHDKLPIVFHPKYDISLLGGIEKLLHPFDGCKYSKVAHTLKNDLKLSDANFHRPAQEVSQNDLEKIHEKSYLESLKKSETIARIAEVFVLKYLPNWLLQWRLLTPMRYATQGTIDAAQLALKDGVAINLGGGYHHARPYKGGGFCFYADMPLAIKLLREQNPDLKVMYVDLDAHQGDGVEECFRQDIANKDKNYVIDCFNPRNYPFKLSELDATINKSINPSQIYCTKHTNKMRGAGFSCHNCNDAYLAAVENGIQEGLQEFKPDLIVYNAGTDCFEEDPIGAMALSKQGIINRDEIVFQKAKENNIPICMTLSGGYSPKSAEIISASLLNLYAKNLMKRDK